MDVQRTRYINSRQGRPSRPGEGPAPPPRGGAAGHTDQPSGCPDSQGPPDAGADGLWLSGFRPREKAERVRNCAALPREFVDAVVLQVAQLLLGGKHLNTSGSRSRTVGTWNRGGNVRSAPRPCWAWISFAASLKEWLFFTCFKESYSRRVTYKLLVSLEVLLTCRPLAAPELAEGRVLTLGLGP